MHPLNLTRALDICHQMRIMNECDLTWHSVLRSNRTSERNISSTVESISYKKAPSSSRTRSFGFQNYPVSINSIASSISSLLENLNSTSPRFLASSALTTSSHVLLLKETTAIQLENGGIQQSTQMTELP